MKTRLLQVTKKKFESLIEQIDSHFSTNDLDEKLTKSELLVYVSLYHRGGMAIEDWESVLRSFSVIAPGRPVFQAEVEAVSLISSSENSYQQAYIALAIDESDLIQPNAVAGRNIFEKKVVVLKSHAYSNENIRKFVHLGLSYRWEGGRLVKMLD